MRIHFKEKKHFVKRLNNQGFTMLEVIISFVIFCMLATFLPLFFSIILNVDPVINRTQQLEFELFVSQLNTELQTCDYVDVRNGKLVLLIGGEEITFERYGSYIRRLVQLRGHELILQNIKTVEFKENQHSIHIKVVDNNNLVYEEQLYPFIQGVGEG